MSWLESIGVFRRPPEARSEAELAAEVHAELEHHLACKVHDLLEQGSTPEQARAEARRSFGDVASVERTCLRLRMGERIMLQRVHLAVTLMLLVGVLFLAWSNHRSGLAAARASEVAAMMREDVQRVMGEAAERERLAPEPVEHIVIGVGDELELSDDYGNLAKERQEVALDGKVLLPDAGWVHVAGMTREEVEEALTRALAPYYVASQVRVKVTKAGSHAFSQVIFSAF